MLNGLDLFSGIGGITLALSGYVRPTAYCEIDRYAQAVLLSRMADGMLPTAPIWDDVTTLTGQHFQGARIDIIYGGFPCQDISTVGRGAGLAGKRSGLFYEIIRLCGELRPSFVFLENVPAITVRGGVDCIAELTRAGYDCRWCIIQTPKDSRIASGHRWFILAKAIGAGLQGGASVEKTTSDGVGKENAMRPTEETFSRLIRETAPDVLRMDHGIPFALDRIKALGNSVVPQQARQAFEYLIGLDFLAMEMEGKQ